jgi:putative nucleotidyltransferase with HDIG domain
MKTTDRSLMAYMGHTYLHEHCRIVTLKKKKDNLYNLPSPQTAFALMSLASRVEQLEAEKKQICEMSLRSMLKALDAKDHYTFGHSTRVAYFSVVTGRELGFDDEQLYNLEMAALFHDIGKIGTPDHILNKPSRLTEDEFLIMKKHPEESSKILEGFEAFEKMALYAKHHHERYDGRGYPLGLKGDKIPLESRIILIADTFDAMTSTRPYRKGLPYQVAYDELDEFKGSQFDPKVVDAFVAGMKKEEKKKEKTFFLNLLGTSFDKDAA